MILAVVEGRASGPRPCIDRATVDSLSQRLHVALQDIEAVRETLRALCSA